MPSESVITEILRKYRLLERGMLRDPADPEIRALFQDTAYSLCVLMGRPTRDTLRCSASAESRQQQPSIGLPQCRTSWRTPPANPTRRCVMPPQCQPAPKAGVRRSDRAAVDLPVPGVGP
ncbi:DUF5133 domain-containing protein [Streptomyces sp. ISL-1]|uniref:DUF5133 domain-containing protein n=1 Tax=Streptomyces sp. ISL-1 TaxID=2817657 RepID=UPI001BE8008E|nr:DUF5133 domain-containing protein [Streptomyces sp. ISL-1]